MSTYPEWTAGQLAQMLSHIPPDAKIRLMDADTNWTITKLEVIYENGAGQNELWFYPSDYSEMTS